MEQNKSTLEPSQIISDDIITSEDQSELTADSAETIATEQELTSEPVSSQSSTKQVPPDSLKANIVALLTRPLLTKKKTDELKDLVSEAEQLHSRIDDTEETIRTLAKSSADLDKKVVRELTRVFNNIRKSQITQEAAIERHIDRLRSSLAHQEAHLQQLQNIVLSKVSDAAGQVSGVNGTITGIRDYLSENNKMLQRLQEGYDFQILKNFVRQITRSISSLDDELSRLTDSDARQALEDTRDDLIDLLERNNVVQIIPAVGTAYEGMQKYAEVLQEKVKSDLTDMIGHIAAVERIGYKYEFNDGQERIIQPAQVKLYE